MAKKYGIHGKQGEFAISAPNPPHAIPLRNGGADSIEATLVCVDHGGDDEAVAAFTDPQLAQKFCDWLNGK